MSAILGILNTRLIVQHFGADAFAQYGLLVAIGTLVPFADLGMSAAVMNAVAASNDAHRDEHVRRVLTTAIRVLVASAATLLTLVVIVSVAGWWPTLLGDALLPDTGPRAAALCAGMIAVSIPAGLGVRILTGLGKNHVPILILGFQTPVVLACLLAIVHLQLGGGDYLAVIPYAVTFCLSVAVTVVAGRRINPVFRLAMRDATRLRTVRGGKVLDVAWPMLVQMIALPIAMQTDRLILSHTSASGELAQYNLAAQMYLPVWQVVNAAGLALWPIFARERVKPGSASLSPTNVALSFGAVATGVCGLITVLAPWLADVASDGAIKLDGLLLGSFFVLMVLQATKYPLGMYMTDAPGLRFQAYMIIALMPVNVGLSWVLATRYGAAGPVIGSAIGVLCCQVVANWIYVRRVRAIRMRERAVQSLELTST
jgi:O-antigen/teichoic acid export membrane protein